RPISSSRATRCAGVIIFGAARSRACACWTSKPPKSSRPSTADWLRARVVRDEVIALLARKRVALGFLCGVATLLLAQPPVRSVAAGMSIAALGELLRVWAAGHLNKSREITSSGPYRWVAHPLYLGSTIMGIGLAIACASVVVAALVAAYLILTLGAAM